MSEENKIPQLPALTEVSALDKKALQALAKSKAAEITESGVLNELEVYIRAKKYSDFFVALASGIKEKAEDEARKEQGKGSFEKFGATVKHTSAPGKWVYDNCNDPIYIRLKNEEEELKQRIKEREAYLQAVPETGVTVFDNETGEVYGVRRAVKISGAEGISITY